MFHKQNCRCADARPCGRHYLERCGGIRSLPRRTKLNSRKRHISASTSLKTTHGALPPVPNFHPWSLCCRQERAECKKEANRKDGEKYGDDEGWVFHYTNGLLISRAREFAPIFCFKARYIVKKESKKKKLWKKNGADDTWAERKTGEIKRKSVKRITFSLALPLIFAIKKVKSTQRILLHSIFHSLPRNKSTFPKSLAKPKTVVG